MSIPPTVRWNPDSGTVDLIDQRRLPAELDVLELGTLDRLCEAITTLAVRGAPALEIAGASGMALAAHLDADPDRAFEMLVSTRPTAVNLEVGAQRALDTWRRKGKSAVSDVALRVFEEDASRNRAISEHGADILASIAEPRDQRLNLITHCNAGHLACGAVGTALGVIKAAYRRDLIDTVFVDETRPLMQGGRLTAWELDQEGISHSIIPDAAAAFVAEREGVDAAVVGADRIAANGDVANKIGTFNLAIVARYFEVPLIVAAPDSTIDFRTGRGADIPIESRDGRELLDTEGWPQGSGHAMNPAFDVTPADLVTHIVTETRTGGGM